MCLVLPPTSDPAAPAWIGYAGSRAKEGRGGEVVENRGGVVRGWEGRGSEGKGRGEEVVVRGGVVRGGEE